jgi:hypothetical protein
MKWLSLCRAAAEDLPCIMQNLEAHQRSIWADQQKLRYLKASPAFPSSQEDETPVSQELQPLHGTHVPNTSSSISSTVNSFPQAGTSAITQHQASSADMDINPSSLFLLNPVRPSISPSSVAQLAQDDMLGQHALVEHAGEVTQIHAHQAAGITACLADQTFRRPAFQHGFLVSAVVAIPGVPSLEEDAQVPGAGSRASGFRGEGSVGHAAENRVPDANSAHPAGDATQTRVLDAYYAPQCDVEGRVSLEGSRVPPLRRIGDVTDGALDTGAVIWVGTGSVASKDGAATGGVSNTRCTALSGGEEEQPGLLGTGRTELLSAESATHGCVGGAGGHLQKRVETSFDGAAPT